MRSKSVYVCQQCGYSQVGWSGKCPNCGTWGSLVETIVEKTSKGRTSSKKEYKKPIPLNSITSSKIQRIKTNISELDRALGGGLVPGQVILLAGEPGIGKSTLLLEVVNKLKDSLYVSGEESANQIKIRADRLKIDKNTILLLEETNIDTIINTIEASPQKFDCIVIDSIQTMYTSDLAGMAGSVGQVRECSNRLVRLAKTTHIPVFIVGHVTKEGSVAGPAALAHIVDTVLWFEGDKSLTLRLVRAIKNRFGPTDEVGIFQMEDKGLTSVEDSGKLFLTQTLKSVPGSVITSVVEGTRPLLVEVQALVVPTKLAFPRHVVQGIDSRRVEVILAVLQRRVGLRIFDNDVFINVAGGITVTEPGADLAVGLAIASSYFDKPLANGSLVFGEVGLLGEIRDVSNQSKRLKEAKRVGYKKFITPDEVKTLSEAVKRNLH